MRIQNRQPKCECEENASQPGRELHKNVRRLRAENVFRDPPAKCCAQAFALRTLHQDHEHHEQGHQNKKHQRQVDQKIHRGGKYRQRDERSKHPTLNIQFRNFSAGRWRFFDLVPILSGPPRSTSRFRRRLQFVSSRLNRAMNGQSHLQRGFASSLHRARLTTARQSARLPIELRSARMAVLIPEFLLQLLPSRSRSVQQIDRPFDWRFLRKHQGGSAGKSSR